MFKQASVAEEVLKNLESNLNKIDSDAKSFESRKKIEAINLLSEASNILNKKNLFKHSSVLDSFINKKAQAFEGYDPKFDEVQDAAFGLANMNDIENYHEMLEPLESGDLSTIEDKIRDYGNEDIFHKLISEINHKWQVPDENVGNQVLEMIVEHPKVTDEILESIFEKGDDLMRIAVISKPDISLDLIEKFYSQYEFEENSTLKEMLEDILANRLSYANEEDLISDKTMDENFDVEFEGNDVMSASDEEEIDETDEFMDMLDELDEQEHWAGTQDSFPSQGDKLQWGEVFLNDRESGAGPDVENNSVNELLGMGYSIEEIAESFSKLTK